MKKAGEGGKQSRDAKNDENFSEIGHIENLSSVEIKADIFIKTGEKQRGVIE